MFHRMAGPYRVISRNSKAVKPSLEISRAEVNALTIARSCYVVRPAYGAAFRVGATCRKGGKIPKITNFLGGSSGKRKKRRR